MGHLAVDLVVSSISPNAHHIGYFYDSCVLPVVGNDAFTQSAESLGKLNVSVEGLLHYCLTHLDYALESRFLEPSIFLTSRFCFPHKSNTVILPLIFQTNFVSLRGSKNRDSTVHYNREIWFKSQSELIRHTNLPPPSLQKLSSSMELITLVWHIMIIESYI